MAYCEFDGQDGFHYRITYSATNDPIKDAAIVNISALQIRADQAVNNVYCFGSVYANSVNQIGGTSEIFNIGTDWTAVPLKASVSNMKSAIVYYYGKDSATCEMKINMAIYKSDKTKITGIYAALPVIFYSHLYALPVRVRKFILGESVTIYTPSVGSGMYSDLIWECGSKSGKISNLVPDRNWVSWFAKEDIGTEEIHKNEVTVKITQRIFMSPRPGEAGAVQIASNSIDLIFEIPEYLLDIGTGIFDVNHLEHYGGFIQGNSIANVIVFGDGKYGSTIDSYTITCGDIKVNSGNARFELPNPGEMSFTCTIVDSRGREASQTQTINVIPWERPSVSMNPVIRCDQDGTANPTGGYTRIIYSGNMTEISGSTPVWKLLRRFRGETSWEVFEIAETTGSFEVTNANFIIEANIDKEYEFCVRAEDSFSYSDSLISTLPVGYALMDFNRNKKSVGIGQRADYDGKLCVGMDIKMHGNKITDLGQPGNDNDAVTLAYVKNFLQALYPVGSLWFTLGDQNPSTLFGGTWERIKDKFLLASGDEISAGDTGGSNVHSHNASGYAEIYVSDNGGIATNRISTETWNSNHNISSAGTHNTTASGRTLGTNAVITIEEANNIPNYLAVNIWKRVS